MARRRESAESDDVDLQSRELTASYADRRDAAPAAGPSRRVVVGQYGRGVAISHYLLPLSPNDPLPELLRQLADAEQQSRDENEHPRWLVYTDALYDHPGSIEHYDVQLRGGALVLEHCSIWNGACLLRRRPAATERLDGGDGLHCWFTSQIDGTASRCCSVRRRRTWGTQVMTVRDPDGHRCRIEAPAAD